MNKLIRDGKVAVLYSPGYGAGWYSWNTGQKDLVFDPEIATAILENDVEKAKTIASAKYPTAYLGGLDDVKVEWLEEGTVFEIDEYDGSEHITLIADKEYLVA